MTAHADVSRLESRIDKLTQALLHVAGELWVARDRQAVLEHVLSAHGAIAQDEVDSYRPDAPLVETLAAERDAYVSSILSYLAPVDDRPNGGPA